MPTNNIEKYFVESDAQCAITMDGTTIQSGDFVAVIAKDDGGHHIAYSTDALTMGLALRMIAYSFVQMYNELPVEDQEMVSAELRDIFPAVTELGTSKEATA